LIAVVWFVSVHSPTVVDDDAACGKWTKQCLVRIGGGLTFEHDRIGGVMR